MMYPHSMLSFPGGLTAVLYIGVATSILQGELIATTAISHGVAWAEWALELEVGLKVAFVGHHLMAPSWGEVPRWVGVGKAEG
jgi:hypothetical protein